MSENVKCTECGTNILAQTAAANGGLCAQCAQVTFRAEKQEFEHRLADGSIFTPCESERATSVVPDELLTGQWDLQPEYYGESNIDSPSLAIAAARSKSQGNVFLVTKDGGQLNLGFTERFAVCEYQNQETGEFRWAFADSNSNEQVPEEFHVVQACPCCGVGMLWYPSRFHMPRDQAFSILENTIAKLDTPGVEWLEADDFSYTGPGRG
jgi:hypothetical protein